MSDNPDWTQGIILVQQGAGPVSTTDVPDWSDPIAVVPTASPNDDYPDWTKATTLVSGNLPSGSPPIANPYAWWDATQISGLTNNTLLTLWPDMSGNSRDVVQDGTYRPTYITSGINGKPCVQWASQTAHNWMAGAIILPQPFTFIAVAQYGQTGLQSMLFGYAGVSP